MQQIQGVSLVCGKLFKRSICFGAVFMQHGLAILKSLLRFLKSTYFCREMTLMSPSWQSLSSRNAEKCGSVGVTLKDLPARASSKDGSAPATVKHLSARAAVKDMSARACLNDMLAGVNRTSLSAGFSGKDVSAPVTVKDMPARVSLKSLSAGVPDVSAQVAVRDVPAGVTLKSLSAGVTVKNVSHEAVRKVKGDVEVLRCKKETSSGKV